MSSTIYITTLCLFLGTIALVFALKYVSAALAARARIAGDTAYRTLAEQAVAAQAENQASLSVVQAELTKVSASLAAVEKILKQVG
jgi:hypothetical protein